MALHASVPSGLQQCEEGELKQARAGSARGWEGTDSDKGPAGTYFQLCGPVVSAAAT